MIDVVAVREALETVLADGPVPAADIWRLGDRFTPPSDRPHLRLSLIWHSQGRTGEVLTEGAGIWQVLVYAPAGTPAAAVEGLALVLGALYEPHMDDGSELGGVVRLTDIAVLSVFDAGGDGDAAARWVVVPLQVDFRIAQIPDGLT